MYKRFLYGEIQVGKEVLFANKINHDIYLEYYKTEGINNDYGIEIVKKEYIGNKIEVEMKCIESITENEEQINYILKKIKENEVTPVTIEYIVNDLLTGSQFN